MCELFAISSRNKKTINTELKEFFSHSAEHPHGWGLALIEKDYFSMEKEPVRALDSMHLKDILERPISSHVALGHIRLATIGNLHLRNCHPFIGIDDSKRQWTLIHNGTIFECEAMQKYVNKQNGDTDSERILLYLIDQMNQKIKEVQRPLSEKERFDIIDKMVVMASPENKLNLIIYDGELLYAHTNYLNSLYQRVNEDSITFSTQPLTNENWDPVPFCQLVAYHQEQLIYTGTNHKHAYYVDSKKMELLFLAFSEL